MMQTFLEMRAAIKRAKYIYVQVRFGVSERWLRLSKREARLLIQGCTPDSPLVDDTAFTWGQNNQDLYIDG